MIGAQSVKNLKKLYTFFAILIGLSCWTAVVNAQTVQMPDASLAAVVRDALGLAHNAPITRPALQGLTSLEASIWHIEEGIDNPIRDLTGLEYATKLTKLFLALHEIRDLRPPHRFNTIRVLKYCFQSDQRLPPPRKINATPASITYCRPNR